MIEKVNQVINMNRALRSDRVLKALIGMNMAEFNALVPPFDDALTKTKREQKPASLEVVTTLC